MSNKKRALTLLENEDYEFVRLIAYKERVSVSEAIKKCVKRAKKDPYFQEIANKPIGIEVDKKWQK